MAFAATPVAAIQGTQVRQWDCMSLIADGDGPFAFAHGMTGPEAVILSWADKGSALDNGSVRINGANIEIERCAHVGNMACKITVLKFYGMIR